MKNYSARDNNRLLVLVNIELGILNIFENVMKVINVYSYNEIRDITNKYLILYNNQIIFRGTANLLLPSITERYTFENDVDLIAKEKLLLNDFNNYSFYNYEFDEKVANDWEIRIAAREHGLASSLMDWSNSLDISLEFAVHNFETKNIKYTSLWILNKTDISQINLAPKMYNKDSFKELTNPTIIQFSRYNHLAFMRRKFIQGGYFLFQPSFEVTLPLEKNLKYSENLTQIVISKNTIPDILKNLSLNRKIDENICPTFGDSSVSGLDDLCRELNKKYL